MRFPAHRYPFAEIREGVFFFVTDSGIYYTVLISNVSDRLEINSVLYNDGNVFEISFFNDGEETGYDQCVFETIIHIIVTNFLARGDISIFHFVCDTTDRRGRFRARLFDSWISRIYSNLRGLVKVDFTIPGYGEDEYDISLFIPIDHPHFSQYISDFGNLLEKDYSKAS